MKPKTAAVYFALAFALSGCGRKSSDGLSTVDRVQPITSLPAGELKAENLTDASALAARLEAVLEATPPLDMNNQASWEARRKIYDAARAKAIGLDRSFLLPISCKASPDKAPLVYFSAYKNIKVQLYSPQQGEAEQATGIYKALNAITRFNEALIDAALFGRDLSMTPNDIADDENFKAFDNSSAAAATFLLPGGSKIFVENSPVSSLLPSVILAVSESNLTTAEFKLALLTGKKRNVASILGSIPAQKEKLAFYPSSALPEPFWTHQFPFEGDAANLCLVGFFTDIDLASGGGDGIIFGAPSGVQLAGTLSGWLLVNKRDMHVIAAARAPVGAPSR